MVEADDDGTDVANIDASLLFPIPAEVETSDGEADETIKVPQNCRSGPNDLLEKQCRICLGGSEDEEELGKLISPCVCNGSMRHVHVSCLNSWRTSSASRVAFWSCPQCGFNYHFARTRVSGLATNKVALLLTTTALFLALTTATGHILTLFLLSKPPNARSADQSVASVLLNESMDIIRFTPTSAAFEIIKDAVGVFARGEVEDVLRFVWSIFDRSGHYLPGGLQKQQGSSKANWKDSVLSFFGAQTAFSLMFSMSLLPMLSMFNIFPGIATSRRRTRTTGNTPRVGAFVIVGLVAVGSIRSFLRLYKTLSFFSMYLLARAETAILEVRPDGRNLDQPAEGTHFRLRRALDISRFKAWAIGALSRGMIDRRLA